MKDIYRAEISATLIQRRWIWSTVCPEYKLCQKQINEFNDTYNLGKYEFNIHDFCSRINMSKTALMRTLGTLGGGNHYIEFNEDLETHEQYVTVHSGSRALGMNIVKNHSRNH